MQSKGGTISCGATNACYLVECSLPYVGHSGPVIKLLSTDLFLLVKSTWSSNEGQ